MEQWVLDMLERAVAWRSEDPKKRNVELKIEAEHYGSTEPKIWCYDYKVMAGFHLHRGGTIPDLVEAEKAALRARLAKLEAA